MGSQSNHVYPNDHSFFFPRKRQVLGPIACQPCCQRFPIRQHGMLNPNRCYTFVVMATNSDVITTYIISSKN